MLISRYRTAPPLKCGSPIDHHYVPQITTTHMIRSAESGATSVLAEQLAKDPMLADFYHQTLAKIQSRVASDSNFDVSSSSSVRIAEEGAMKEAIRLRDLEVDLTRRGPGYRKRYKEALALITKARLKG
jgi:hypothetical protein